MIGADSLLWNLDLGLWKLQLGRLLGIWGLNLGIYGAAVLGFGAWDLEIPVSPAFLSRWTSGGHA
jgi:hypothetical protein